MKLRYSCTNNDIPSKPEISMAHITDEHVTCTTKWFAAPRVLGNPCVFLGAETTSFLLIRMNRVNNWMSKLMQGIGKYNEALWERILHLEEAFRKLSREGSSIPAHLPRRPLWRNIRGSGVTLCSCSSSRGTHLVSNDLKVRSYEIQHHLWIVNLLKSLYELVFVVSRWGF